MLGTTQLNFFEDQITYNNGYMKHAHTRQRMTNNSNNNNRKQFDTPGNPHLLSDATTVVLKFKLNKH